MGWYEEAMRAEKRIDELNEELRQIKEAVGLLFTAYLRAERDDDEIERAVRLLMGTLGWPSPVQVPPAPEVVEGEGMRR